MDDIEGHRLVPFSAMFNFRDVGGYPGHGGRKVRWGRLYRSDSLHRIDATDREAFAALGVRTVIDLRRPEEVSRDGRVPAYDGLAYRHIHPEHRDWGGRPYTGDVSLAHYLAGLYRDLVETGTEGLAAAIRIIADAEAAPVVVHCVAGKDRTGIVCALALSVLGVDEAQIAADYALSTAATHRFQAWAKAALPEGNTVPVPVFDSPAEAMTLFLADLRDRYGSAEGYLRAAGVSDPELTALRAHLLQ